MMDLPIRRSASTAWAFIALSSSRTARQYSSITALSASTFGANAGKASTRLDGGDQDPGCRLRAVAVHELRCERHGRERADGRREADRAEHAAAQVQAIGDPGQSGGEGSR